MWFWPVWFHKVPKLSQFVASFTFWKQFLEIICFSTAATTYEPFLTKIVRKTHLSFSAFWLLPTTNTILILPQFFIKAFLSFNVCAYNFCFCLPIVFTFFISFLYLFAKYIAKTLCVFICLCPPNNVAFGVLLHNLSRPVFLSAWNLL